MSAVFSPTRSRVRSCSLGEAVEVGDGVDEGFAGGDVAATASSDARVSSADCVGCMFGERVAEELGDHGVAEAFDVHDAARGPVEELAGDARGAGGVDAAPVDFAFCADEIGAADGAAFGEDDLFGAARVILARATTSVILGMTSPPRSTETKSPILHAEAVDLVGVVERGARDGGAADEDRARARRRV